jgi:CheY-like chemotaxis protein
MEKQALPTTGEFSRGRVLIVDDDLSMARSIDRALFRAGYQTQLAQDGLHAGLMLGTFKPHVVTLDILMQGMSGIGVLRFIRSAEQCRTSRVLVISASGPAQLQAALNAGADDVLTKPFPNEALLEKVSRLMKLHTIAPHNQPFAVAMFEEKC